MNEAELRARLACWLEGNRAAGAPWLDAVREVPRHVLVPDGEAWLTSDGLTGGEDRPRHAYTEEGWLEALYSDVTVVTRRDEQGGATSSSTAPGTVVRMLEFLAVRDGHDVLEIGTGTGYSTALLCHRLGSHHVTSVDIQADLISEARERLASIGYRPTLRAANGAEGWPGAVPYDRVIGTAFTWPVPLAWLQQTRPGGRIVAVVPSGVVGLNVRPDGSASGRFRRGVFGFMPMQQHVRQDQLEGPDSGDCRPWRYPPTIMGAGGADLPFALLAHTIVLPYVLADWDHATPAEVAEVDLSDAAGSRAVINAGETYVTEGGSLQLWAEVEDLYEEWCQLGAPARERFGLTVAADGQHTLWLDDPDSAHRWDVTPSAREETSSS